MRLKVCLSCEEIVRMQNTDYNFFWCKLKNQPIGLGCEKCSMGRVEVEEYTKERALPVL